MPVLAALVLAAVLPAAQVRTHTGQTFELTRPAITGPQRRIVEFREAPLARRGVSAQAAGYRDTFQRFRSDLAAASPQSGRQAIDRVRHELFRTFHGVAVTLDDNEAAAVRRFPYVRAVHEDRPVKAFAEDMTRIERIGADRVWSELHTRGAGIRVAVIDTGVDHTHPALAGKVVPGFDYVAGDVDPMDEHGHGTHVAGIIVGDTADVRGVAPDVQVVAYRVLGSNGQGYVSDIIQAIDDAVDPNHDGDLSDGVEIINLSLGSHMGDADDPGSVAVDNAVRAGVVVVVAAGNEGWSQSVGSPAAARLAITVGNSDEHDRIGIFSSFGPTFPDLDPKPELAAPGTEIRSAALGGGTVVASGTSMAAPHVSGAVALLLALHPDWTPEEVKAALTTSAEPMLDDVMQQGAGRLDAYGAATLHSLIAPGLVSIGRSPSNDDWTSSRTVRIANRGTAARTYTAKVVAPAHVSIDVEPAQFTLEPGASRDVVLNASVGANVEAPNTTMAFGGRVDFESDGTPVRVPWVGLRAARTVVNYAGVFPSIMWSCPGPTAFFGQNRIGYDTLLPYADCTLLIYADSSSEYGPVLVVAPQQVTGDLDLSLGPEDAAHTFRLAGTGPDGKLLSESAVIEEGAVHFSHYYVDLPGLAFAKFIITTYINTPFRVSTLGPGFTLTGGELLLDVPKRRLVSVRYPELRGIQSDRTMTSLPSDLRHARVEVAPQQDRVIGGQVVVLGPGGPEFLATAGATVSLAEGWTGDVYVAEDADAKYSFGGSFVTQVPAQLQWDMNLPAFRVIDGGVGFSNDLKPAPNAIRIPAGGTLRLGKRPLVPHTLVDRHFLGTSFSMVFGFSGMAGELYGMEARGVGLTIRDAGGNVVEQSIISNSFNRDFGRQGAYRVDLQAKHAHVALSFDTSRVDYNPPLLNTLRIENGTVYLAVGDWKRITGGYLDDSGDVRRITLASRGGDGVWRDIALTKVLEDLGAQEQLGHFPSGVHWRGALPTTAGDVDLKVEMEDGSGNWSVITLDDVFGAGVTRRRAAGK